VFKLITGRRAMICDDCVARALSVVDREWPADATGQRIGTRHMSPSGVTCDFGGETEALAFVAGDNVAICDACVDTCRDIIAEEIEKEKAELGG
jgi:ATP-dependent protease Clp ATPase subunit